MAAAPVLARNFLIALFVSQFLAIRTPARITNNAGTGIPDSFKLVQTILFFPPQERSGGNCAAFLRASCHGPSRIAVKAANSNCRGGHAPYDRETGEASQFGRISQGKAPHAPFQDSSAAVSSFTWHWRGLKCRDSQWSRHELLAF
ncbi:MAG: hypothetical protein ACT6SC_21695, partial [Blastomonas fulva]